MITMTSKRIIRAEILINGSYPAIAINGPPNQIHKAKQMKPKIVIKVLDFILVISLFTFSLNDITIPCKQLK